MKTGGVSICCVCGGCHVWKSGHNTILFITLVFDRLGEKVKDGCASSRRPNDVGLYVHDIRIIDL